MASAARPITPDRTEKALGALALVMLALVVTAVLRGSADWDRLPPQVWVHLATICLPLALTPVILWSPRGTRRHRVLGYVWAACMAATAIDSFWIRSSDGRLGPIHILSATTLVLLVVLVVMARRHEVKHHRSTARGIIVGALLIAGFFTFPFNRLLGRWLLG
ncbi:hypothetical protein B2G71_15700 [Novosphingobium sp. PC22D]|uniref:DUF2306 domain-containing protein n=1 Tax=Novosphingobium sp. PC22D TaxID=1962403 RepID=UPI000BF206B1|nr:hypothetical protein [Novosphingobium sp. PC22D]PEQ11573.1 hypothetical protein B2G71_15700 [Novosphingobium sp. PC22D]